MYSIYVFVVSVPQFLVPRINQEGWKFALPRILMILEERTEAHSKCRLVMPSSRRPCLLLVTRIQQFHYDIIFDFFFSELLYIKSKNFKTTLTDQSNTTVIIILKRHVSAYRSTIIELKHMANRRHVQNARHSVSSSPCFIVGSHNFIINCQYNFITSHTH